MTMLRCDLEGVPKLVQNIKYNYTGMWFVFTLFTGEKQILLSELVQGIGLMTRPENITDEQFWDAETRFLLGYDHG